MNQQYFLFFGLVCAFIVALCISVYVIVNKMHCEVYELKKEFERFMDAEQEAISLLKEREIHG